MHKKINFYTICVGTKKKKAILEAKDYKSKPKEWKKLLFSNNKESIKANELYIGDSFDNFKEIKHILENKFNYKVDYYIISAGAGIIKESQKIMPYNAAFSPMAKENQVKKNWFLNILGNTKIKRNKNIINIFLLSGPYFRNIKHLLELEDIIITSKSSCSTGFLKDSCITYDKRARNLLKTGDIKTLGKFCHYLFLKATSLNKEHLKGVSKKIMNSTELNTNLLKLIK